MDGQFIKSMMRAKGLTIEDLTKEIGVSSQTVALWLSGAETPSRNNLYKLAKTLGVPTHLLFAPINFNTKTFKSLAKNIGITKKELNKLKKMTTIEQLGFISTLIAKRLYCIQKFQEELDHAIGNLLDIFTHLEAD